MIDQLLRDVTTPPKRAGFDLDDIIKRAESTEGAPDTVGEAGAEDGDEGNINPVDGAPDTVELPPEMQHIIMMLMQHPEILQMLIRGDQGLPDSVMPPGGQPSPDVSTAAGQTGAPGIPPTA